MALVKERVADGRVLALVESFHQAGVLEESKGWQRTESGTPQGGVISPLLANLYLDPFDHQMERAGWELMRYADDFVILCRTQAQAQTALGQVQAWVKEAGPTLHPEKTRIVNAKAPRRVRPPRVSLRAGHEMAASQEPEEVERTDPG